MTTVEFAATGSAAVAPPRRIVSLVPSLTEALFALGAGDRVVGVTRFCEEPALGLGGLQRVGGTKNPSVDAILELAPDLVVTSSEENRKEDVELLRARGLQVLVTHYPTVGAALDGMEALARRAGVDASAQPWLVEARKRARAAADSPPTLRYFCPIWRNPYMVARSDTYMSDLLALAGGINVFPDRGELHYFPVDLESLRVSPPDVVLLPDEPYRFARRHLADFAELRDLPAFARDRLYFVDGKALTWYGPRTGVALESFARLFREAAMEQGGADG
jgi:ABC-type Fe3+-hydroxamate transport system substrate-binding protein